MYLTPFLQVLQIRLSGTTKRHPSGPRREPQTLPADGFPGRSSNYNSSRSVMAAGVTRPFCTRTPSACRRRACSLCSRDDFGNTMRPPAPTTRCHGRFSASGATLSANPAWRARPGSPAARATAPYVETRPRGIAQTTCQMPSSAGLSSAAGSLRDRELVEFKGRKSAVIAFFWTGNGGVLRLRGRRLTDNTRRHRDDRSEVAEVAGHDERRALLRQLAELAHVLLADT